MDLEFHQLDLRYEELRGRSPARERRLLSSLAEVGQQAPIVVVSAASSERPIVIDGYKRVRLLRRLGQDTVRATTWDLGEAEALLLERMLRAGDADNALEQGWFLRELRIRFGLSGEELSKRFGRTPSWVSRRLSLVAELPESVQAHVRAGAIGAHAAMKYLVPLARANRADGERLADAVAPLKLTTRQMAIVYAAWLGANPEARALIVKDPALVVRAHEEARRAKARPATPAEQMLSDLGALSGLAARVHQRMRRGELRGLLEPERAEIRHAYSQACREVERLIKRLGKELEDARREHESRDPATP
jgi:ParB family chromosome partitioning protein